MSGGSADEQTLCQGAGSLAQEQRVVATPFGDVTLGMFTALDADTAAFFTTEAAAQRVDWPKPANKQNVDFSSRYQG